MDLQNMDLNGGTLQISTEVIGKIARCAALEVDGVSEISCGKQNKKVKDLLEAASIQPAVTVEMRDGTAELILNLVVAFGARIPAVAEKVQENVKTAVQNMTNVTVSRVNLVIAGVAAENRNKVRGILWKIFCPVVKPARMRFCWLFRRRLVTCPCGRLCSTTPRMKSIPWMCSASGC